MILTYYALDQDHAVLGQIDAYTKMEFVPAYNTARGWYMEMDPDTAQATVMQAAVYLLAVNSDSEAIWSGTIDDIELDGETNVLTIRGVCETAILNDRLALPVPSGPPYTSSEYDSRSGTAENVIKAYINYNAGLSANVDRRIYGLTVETDYGRGGAYSGMARFDKLADLVFGIGISKDLWVRVLNGVALVQEPVDRTALIQLSDVTDTLLKWKFHWGKPKTNYIYGGGAGSGTSQAIYERGDGVSISQYGRREGFLNIGRTAVTGEIADQIDAELAKTAAIAWFEFVVNPDMPDRVLGVDYWVGDLVSVTIKGVSFTARLSEVTITDTKDKIEVKPVFVNNASYTLSRNAYDRFRRLEERIARLEVQ